MGLRSFGVNIAHGNATRSQALATRLPAQADWGRPYCRKDGRPDLYTGSRMRHKGSQLVPEIPILTKRVGRRLGRPLLIRGMRGLGDNLYQRAFLSALFAANPGHPIYLDTPWPQLYADMPGIRFVRVSTHLRTQRKNLASLSGMKWHSAPLRAETLEIKYSGAGILAGMAECFGIMPARMTMPPMGKNPFAKQGRPYVIVRPVTVRREWANESRNPLPPYLVRAVDKFRAAGYTIISVADLDDGQEWTLDPLPRADITMHKGELGIKALLAACAGASAVIGGIGWIVPFCIAAEVPTLVIGGGNGGYNAPWMLTKGFARAQTPIHFATPINLCPCKEKHHDCDKRIAPLNLDACIAAVLADAEAVRAGADLESSVRNRVLSVATHRI